MDGGRRGEKEGRVRGSGGDEKGGTGKGRGSGAEAGMKVWRRERENEEIWGRKGGRRRKSKRDRSLRSLGEWYEGGEEEEKGGGTLLVIAALMENRRRFNDQGHFLRQ